MSEHPEPTVKFEEDHEPSQSQRKRKKKVEIACVYCRRSHMICDELRPCQRCIKRGIGHLCYDEPLNSRQRKKAAALRSEPTPEARPRQQTQPAPAPSQPQAIAMQPAALAPAIPTMGLLNHPEHGLMAASATSDGLMPLNPLLDAQQLEFSVPKKPPLVLAQTLPYNQEPFFYSEHAGSEFSSLNDFLLMIDDPDLVNGALNDDAGMMNLFGTGPGFDVGTPNNGNNGSSQNITLMLFGAANTLPTTGMFGMENQPQSQVQTQTQPQNPPSSGTGTGTGTGNGTALVTPAPDDLQKGGGSSTSVNQMGHQPVISDLARDKFFLTAADPTTEISPEERLKQVIKAKLEAGLLQPYNYAKGYARLQAFMDNYMNISLRQRILKPLLIFRPAFRAIARTLKDVDLVLVEELFERMLLDYDRVFTLMAIPACLWRRTGEIYRGNKEFALLVGVKADDLKDGKLAIYELMSEESAVNFWEKYGAIAFDKGQKAVLTLCNLRTRDGIKRKLCCFSFTIRRDRYNIPSCIVGNFIPIDP